MGTNGAFRYDEIRRMKLSEFNRLVLELDIYNTASRQEMTKEEQIMSIERNRNIRKI